MSISVIPNTMSIDSLHTIKRNSKVLHSSRPIGPPVRPPAEQTVLDSFRQTSIWQNLSFYQKKQDGNYFVDVVNEKTNEVLRTYPVKEFQSVFREIGLLYSKQA